MVLVWDDVLSTLQKQAKLRDLLQHLIDGPDAAVAGPAARTDFGAARNRGPGTR